MQRQLTCGINLDDFEEMPGCSDDEDGEDGLIKRALIQPQRELVCHTNNLKEISLKLSGMFSQHLNH